MILAIPHPGLRKKCVPVGEGEDANPIACKLCAALAGAGGIGLAAPQIGILKRVILIGTDRGEIVMVNPVITERSKETLVAREACLSIPVQTGLVARHVAVSVEYMTARGVLQSLDATGLTARCIQHEIDHLDGTLFTDRAR